MLLLVGMMAVAPSVSAKTGIDLENQSVEVTTPEMFGSVHSVGEEKWNSPNAPVDKTEVKYYTIEDGRLYTYKYDRYWDPSLEMDGKHFWNYHYISILPGSHVVIERLLQEANEIVKIIISNDDDVTEYIGDMFGNVARTKQ